MEEFLSGIKFDATSSVIKTFLDNALDMTKLNKLNESHLKELLPKIGDRIVFQEALERYNKQASKIKKEDEPLSFLRTTVKVECIEISSDDDLINEVERKKSPHGFDKSFKKTNTKKRQRIFESDEDMINGSATVYDEDIALPETQKRQANGVSLKNPKCDKRLANISATETDRDVRASLKKPETKKRRANDSATESDEDSLKELKADKRQMPLNKDSKSRTLQFSDIDEKKALIRSTLKSNVEAKSKLLDTLKSVLKPYESFNTSTPMQIINYDNASLDCPFCKCPSTPQPKSSKKHGVYLDINNFKRHLLGMHNITSLSIAADKQANDGDSKALEQPTTNATEKEGKLRNGKNQTDKKFNVGDGIASLQSAADRVKKKKRKSSSSNDQDSATDRNGSDSDVDAPMEQPAADQAQNDNGLSSAADKQVNDGYSKALEQPITNATEKEGKLTNGKNQTDKKFNVGDGIASLQSAADRVKKKKRKSSSSNGTIENVSDGEATTEQPSTDPDKNKKWSASPNDQDSATDRNGSDSDVDAPMEQPAADQAQNDNGLSSAADKQVNDGYSKALEQPITNATEKEGKLTNGKNQTDKKFNVGDGIASLQSAADRVKKKKRKSSSSNGTIENVSDGEATTEQPSTDPDKNKKWSASPNDQDSATDRNGSDSNVDAPMEQPAADQTQNDNGRCNGFIGSLSNAADKQANGGDSKACQPPVMNATEKEGKSTNGTADEDFLSGPEIESSCDEDDFIEQSEDTSESSSEDEFKDAESISEKSEERLRRKRHVPKRQY